MHWVGCVAVHICVAFDDWIVWIQWISIGLYLSWIGLDCIGLVALRFTFALFGMIGLFGLSGYRLDCIEVGLDWIGI